MVVRRPLAEPGQVSVYLGVPLATLTAWRYRKIGPCWTKVGRHVRYRWEDVDAWLAAQAGTGGGTAA